GRAIGRKWQRRARFPPGSESISTVRSLRCRSLLDQIKASRVYNRDEIVQSLRARSAAACRSTVKSRIFETRSMSWNGCQWRVDKAHLPPPLCLYEQPFQTVWLLKLRSMYSNKVAHYRECHSRVCGGVVD